MAMAMACCHPVVVPAPAAVSSVSSLSSAAAASQSPASFTPTSIRSPFKPLSLPANRHHLRAFVIRAAAAEGKEPSDLPPSQKQKSMVPIKPTKKQQVTLRFVWMEKNIGLALDQVVPGYGTIPLSPYYFWPRKDAWEELKTKLESKKWISRKQTILLLNQATDIINLWQQNAASM